MNVLRAMAVRDIEEATRSIPVIDFAPALRGEPDALDPASVIECLPSCVGPENPPRYPPAVYRDLVLAFYNANCFHQQGYVG